MHKDEDTCKRQNIFTNGSNLHETEHADHRDGGWSNQASDRSRCNTAKREEKSTTLHRDQRKTTRRVAYVLQEDDEMSIYNINQLGPQQTRWWTLRSLTSAASSAGGRAAAAAVLERGERSLGEEAAARR